ncbi:hypothetical protein IFM89_017499 [Coptis chinensis]|uniref:Pectinesterase n=1 Tax=Coptis chinensis TaxID=261450 RepID=A0A835HR66_9MAGN|nr:hypothetical protein IFM89_017499 [Coptis chinensis]
MRYLQSSALVFLSVVIVLSAMSAESWVVPTKQLDQTVIKTITVGSNGDYSTIQSAIDSVPSNNDNWIRVYVKGGDYREKVVIPQDKPYIILEGDESATTTILWNDYDDIEKPTFAVLADNFVAKSISFKNTAYNENPRHLKAVAALIAGDKSAFYKCSFYGVQDTLYDKQGRHYFRSCYIEGAVDFIFGNGQSIYESCSIHVTGEVLGPGFVGFITAQSRSSPKENTGFVFKSCRVFGCGATFLGRAWGRYSRVMFYQSDISNVVVPLGWDAWNFTGNEETILYAEHECSGSGSNRSKRVSWIKELSDKDAAQLADISFIDQEGWLRNQP